MVCLTSSRGHFGWLFFFPRSGSALTTSPGLIELTFLFVDVIGTTVSFARGPGRLSLWDWLLPTWVNEVALTCPLSAKTNSISWGCVDTAAPSYPCTAFWPHRDQRQGWGVGVGSRGTAYQPLSPTEHTVFRRWSERQSQDLNSVLSVLPNPPTLS